MRFHDRQDSRSGNSARDSRKTHAPHRWRSVPRYTPGTAEAAGAVPAKTSSCKAVCRQMAGKEASGRKWYSYAKPFSHILNSVIPHLVFVSNHSGKYVSGNLSQFSHSPSQIQTHHSLIFTVSHGNQIILLIYGIVFHCGTKTITSHLSSLQSF